jgi:hypothetical protein
VHQRLGARSGRGARNIGCAIHVDRHEVALENADEVDDRVGGGDRPLHAFHVAHVGPDKLDLPDPSERLEEEGALGLAFGHPYPDARFEELLDCIAADEAAAAEDGDQAFGAIDHPGALACPRGEGNIAVGAALTLPRANPNSRRLPTIFDPCPGGGIGRRTSFRCWRSQGRGGSSPLLGTILLSN